MIKEILTEKKYHEAIMTIRKLKSKGTGKLTIEEIDTIYALAAAIEKYDACIQALTLKNAQA